MAEDLKQVIARIKAKQQSSQQSQKVEKPVVNNPVPAPIEAEEEEFDEEEEMDEEMPKAKEISPVKPQKQVAQAQIDEVRKRQEEIMLLQDNGIYRVQLLNQLQEINKALVVIAGVLVDLSNGKATE